MQEHHDQVAEYESQDCPHHDEMPQPCPMKAAYQPGEPRELHRLPDSQPSNHRENTQSNGAGIGQFLKRVVRFAHYGFWPEEEIPPDHRPNTGNIVMGEQHLAVISAEDFVPQVNQSRRDVDPHESEMPLQSAAEPATDGESLRPIQQILFRNLGAETGERTKDLESAPYHDEQGHGIQPVAKANDERMFVHGTSDRLGVVPIHSNNFQNRVHSSLRQFPFV